MMLTFETSYYASLDERFNLALTISPQSSQNLLSVLPESRRWQSNARLCMRILHRNSCKFDPACPGVLDFLNHFPMYHLWMLKRLLNVIDGCKGDAEGLEFREPIRGGMLAEDVAQKLDLRNRISPFRCREQAKNFAMKYLLPVPSGALLELRSF